MSFVSAAASVVGGVGLSVGGEVFNAVPWFLHVLSLSSLSAIFRRKFSWLGEDHIFIGADA